MYSTLLKSFYWEKELNFAKPPDNINEADRMIHFELLYRYVDSLEVSNLTKRFIQNSLKHSVFPSYKDTGQILEKNLPKIEFDAWTSLLRNKDNIVKRIC